MDIRPTPAVQVEDEEGYFALIRAAFGQRRKTAANAIAGGLNLPKEKVIAAIEASGFDARIRPEALTPVSYTHLDGQEVPVQQPGQILMQPPHRVPCPAQEPAARPRCWPVLFACGNDPLQAEQAAGVLTIKKL